VFHIRIPLRETVLEVWDVPNEKCWPRAESHLEVREDCLVVPVYDGSRRRKRDSAYYLIGANHTLAGFREVLLNAEIGTMGPEQ
jgi:hypothetical protein